MLSLIRYHLRSLAFRAPLLRRMLPANDNDSAEYWDKILATSHKTYLGGPISLEMRAAITAVLLKRYAPTGSPSIIDVGCAGCELAKAVSFDRYLAMDISPYAIEKCKQDPAFKEKPISFLASNLCDFTTDERWDAVVFNEVLYYLDVDQAVSEVYRYWSMLKQDGVVIVAMKHDGKSQAIFRSLKLKWLDGIVWQARSKPDYRIRIDRERPGYLMAVLRS